LLACVPNVLTRSEIATARCALDEAEWIDGRATAGKQSALAKHNKQLAEDSALARELGAAIQRALLGNALFISAALPLKIFPPLFNRYEIGESFGLHVDNAIRAGTSVRIRTDLSCTLFFSEPEEYDGGELAIETQFGAQEVKLPAGDLVLYPSSSLHRVNAVTRGARVASFFWLQSMVRDDGARSLLFDLDQSIQALAGRSTEGHADPEVIRLSSVYHNLVRRWADS